MGEDFSWGVDLVGFILVWESRLSDANARFF